MLQVVSELDLLLILNPYRQRLERKWRNKQVRRELCSLRTVASISVAQRVKNENFGILLSSHFSRGQNAETQLRLGNAMTTIYCM